MNSIISRNCVSVRLKLSFPLEMEKNSLRKDVGCTFFRNEFIRGKKILSVSVMLFWNKQKMFERRCFVCHWHCKLLHGNVFRLTSFVGAPNNCLPAVNCRHSENSWSCSISLFLTFLIFSSAPSSLLSTLDGSKIFPYYLREIIMIIVIWGSDCVTQRRYFICGLQLKFI